MVSSLLAAASAAQRVLHTNLDHFLGEALAMARAGDQACLRYLLLLLLLLLPGGHLGEGPAVHPAYVNCFTSRLRLLCRPCVGGGPRAKPERRSYEASAIQRSPHAAHCCQSLSLTSTLRHLHFACFPCSRIFSRSRHLSLFFRHPQHHLFKPTRQGPRATPSRSLASLNLQEANMADETFDEDIFDDL